MLVDELMELGSDQSPMKNPVPILFIVAALTGCTTPFAASGAALTADAGAGGDDDAGAGGSVNDDAGAGGSLTTSGGNSNGGSSGATTIMVAGSGGVIESGWSGAPPALPQGGSSGSPDGGAPSSGAPQGGTTGAVCTVPRAALKVVCPDNIGTVSLAAGSWLAQQDPTWCTTQPVAAGTVLAIDVPCSPAVFNNLDIRIMYEVSTKGTKGGDNPPTGMKVPPGGTMLVFE
jgi:hypothetical protein